MPDEGQGLTPVGFGGRTRIACAWVGCDEVSYRKQHGIFLVALGGGLVHGGDESSGMVGEIGVAEAAELCGDLVGGVFHDEVVGGQFEGVSGHVASGIGEDVSVGGGMRGFERFGDYDGAGAGVVGSPAEVGIAFIISAFYGVGLGLEGGDVFDDDVGGASVVDVLEEGGFKEGGGFAVAGGGVDAHALRRTLYSPPNRPVLGQWSKTLIKN